MTVGPTATKKNVLEQLLDQGMVLVAIDARVEGVDVPDHLGRDPQLRLNLSYRFGLPISVDEWGVAATLTFAGIPYDCRFPWKSMFLMVSHVSGQPYLFPDDIPTELLTQTAVDSTEVQAPAESTSGSDNKAEGARPKLTLVNSPMAEAAPPPDEPPPDEPPPSPPVEPDSRAQGTRRRGHLRLVK